MIIVFVTMGVPLNFSVVERSRHLLKGKKIKPRIKG